MFKIFRQKDINFKRLAKRLLSYADDTEYKEQAIKTALPKLLQLLPAGHRKLILFNKAVARNPIWQALVEWSNTLDIAEGEEELRKKFFRQLDRQLIQSLRSESMAVFQTVENLMLDMYIPILHMKDYRKFMLSQEKKSDVFFFAFGKFIARVRSTEWKWDERTALKTFFEKILRDEFVDAIRKQGAAKNQNTLAFQTEQLEILIKDFNIRIDADMSQEALLKLRAASPTCFDLIDMYHRGYKYEELTEQFGGNAEQLRKRAYRCREQLQRLWTILTNH